MKKILFLLLLLSFCKIKSQTYVLITDSNFAAYLHSIVPTAMNGNSLNISHTSVTTKTEIYVPSSGISNLNGVQYFTSLKKLICSFNSITNMPTIPNSVETLYFVSNQVSNLQNLPNSLKELNCSNNSLTSLPPLPNSLRFLNCSYNSLAILPGLPLTINELWCNNNQLTSIPTLPNSLGRLYCDYNNITCFPTFPNSIKPPYYYKPTNSWWYNITLSNNPFNCLPNYLPGKMEASLLAYPICAIGNSNGCAMLGQINIFPNPSTGKFTIETTDTEKQRLQLFDINGKLLISKEYYLKAIIDAAYLDEGIYNLTIKTNDHIINKKLVLVK